MKTAPFLNELCCYCGAPMTQEEDDLYDGHCQQSCLYEHMGYDPYDSEDYEDYELPYTYDAGYDPIYGIERPC